MNDGLASWAARSPLAVVLGSGLAGACERGEIARRVPFAGLPGFAEPSVPGHPGFAALVSFSGRPALVFAGRTHVYEGRGPGPVVAAVSLAASLGCRGILFTNAAGSLDAALPPGAWLLPSDVVSFPARAALSFAWSAPAGVPGAGRPGLLVSRRLREAVGAAARAAGSSVSDGVLAWMPGPCYETAAEARAAATAGARAATMSTLPELIAARRHGLEAAVLSRVVNFAPNVAGEPVDHAAVVRRSGEACGELAAILCRVLAGIDRPK